MRLLRLQQFICDACNEVIEKVGDGWLEWHSDNSKDNPICGFRIVHTSGSPPSKKHGGKICYYPEEGSDIGDNHLEVFTGPDGLAYLLSFFERNLADPKELVEIIRRIHIPHYEEARHYIDKAFNDGFIYSRDYSQNDLKRVIKEYNKI